MTNKFEVADKTYKKRITGSLTGLLIMWALLTALLFTFKLNMIIVLCSSTELIIYYLVYFLPKAKNYLQSVEFLEDQAIITFREYDSMTIIRLPVIDVKFKLNESLMSFFKVGRNFVLVIEIRAGKLTFQEKIKQHEIGDWNLALFKQFIDFVNKNTSSNISTMSAKRSNF